MSGADQPEPPKPSKASKRPKLVLAHWDGLKLFDAAARAQLNEVGELLNDEPLASWDDPRADALLAEAEVIVGHWGCPALDKAMLARTPNLGLFAYTAGTLKGLVSNELWGRGVRVTSGANANAEPVAEFTLAAILMINKDVVWQRDLMGDPSIADQRQPSETPVGNWDKTIGIISASLVGRRVIELLRPFPRLPVLLFDPFVSAEEADTLGVTKVELDELCARSDIVSVHAPLLPETIDLVAAPELAAMRTGTTLINTARGPIVNPTALTAELSSGRLSAWLDVTEPEPLPADDPLRKLPNVVLTPHLAGTQGTELGRMTDFVAEEIRRWAHGEPAHNGITQDMLGRLA